LMVKVVAADIQERDGAKQRSIVDRPHRVNSELLIFKSEMAQSNCSPR